VRPFVAVLAAAIGVAAIALILDSPALIVLSILMIAGDVIGALALGLRTAHRGDFVIPFVTILAVALGVAALGVIAIVVGERGDAPGLMLFGIVVITSENFDGEWIARILERYGFGTARGSTSRGGAPST
jgi:hypothetical protein